MKEFKACNLRNIAVLGHQGSGKTSLMESVLFVSEAIAKKGSIETGTTISDHTKEEKNQKISIYSSVLPVLWGSYKYNFIDTPGFFDFGGEVNGALRVTRSALIVIDAGKGVEVGTKKAWKAVRSGSLPAVIFVNKMDKDNVNFDHVLEQIREKLGKRAVPFCWPIGHENNFEGFVNVVEMTARLYNGVECVDAEIWEERKEQVARLHDMIVESVANIDDAILEKYLNGDEVSQEEVRKGLREGVLKGELVPVLVGSSSKNIGIHTLLNMIGNYLPSEEDMRQSFMEANESVEMIERKVDVNEPFSGIVFKTIVDPFIGKISFISVRSGILKKDQIVFNSTKDTKERINNIAFIRGKEQIETDMIIAGDIGVVMKVASLETGDTLCDPSKPLLFKSIQGIQPTIHYAISVKTKNDEGKITEALRKIALEDLSISVERNIETNQLLVGCQGQLHMDTIVEKLKSLYGIEAYLETARVSYRETIRGKADVEGRFVKQSGGSGQYGIVKMKFEPCDSDFEFVNDVFGGSVPSNFVPAVEKGMIEVLLKGPLAGFPVLGVKAILYDGKYHDVDSSEFAFKMAASIAFKEACRTGAKPTLLEPIVEIQVVAPNEYVGDIMGDLNKRRGIILGIEPVGDEQIITAEVPQTEVLTYIIDLKTMTQAQATFTMKFVRYEDVPSFLSDKILKSLPKED